MTAPLRHAATPQDVASTVCWFIEAAELVTGQIFVLDAGMTPGALPGHSR